MSVFASVSAVTAAEDDDSLSGSTGNAVDNAGALIMADAVVKISTGNDNPIGIAL